MTKKRKREMRDNLEEEKKEYSKKEDNKGKKEKCDNLGGNEKEQLGKYEKEGKKLCVITSMIMKKKK